MVHVLPSPKAIDISRSKLLQALPTSGLGVEHTAKHLETDILSGLNKPSCTANFYGFVTGGVTEAAGLADHLVTKTDQNVQVHLPRETIATDVEDRALRMICELLELASHDWVHRTFTTGATASNVVGLACGREYSIRRAAERKGLGQIPSVAEHGLFKAMRLAGLDGIQVLTTVPHSSLRKAASIVGVGRDSVVDIGLNSEPHRFDLDLLERYLQQGSVASIVAVSCAEVNIGLFATTGDELREIRRLCDQYGAWIHIDAAFGLLARVLPNTPEYQTLKSGVSGLELADSITGDAHKLLNVPYDCGIFLSRHLNLGIDVFRNTNAAYLTASDESTTSADYNIPSPLNIGIENSRRFRALPVYATLAAYGRDGYRDMLQRQIQLARGIADFIAQSRAFELLPSHNAADGESGSPSSAIFIIVLFRARDEALNDMLVQRINASRRIYVSGTQWDCRPAARFAVANWMADIERDLPLIQEVLDAVTLQ